jgi:hypothetical protein
MYAAIIATWTQAVITAMTMPPLRLHLREAETTLGPSIRPDVRAREEHSHQSQAVVLAFPRGGVAASQPNAHT